MTPPRTGVFGLEQSRRKYARQRVDRLIRPAACEQCHEVTEIEAHHDDHLDKLNVRWLCRICHRGADKALREAA